MGMPEIERAPVFSEAPAQGTLARACHCLGV